MLIKISKWILNYSLKIFKKSLLRMNIVVSDNLMFDPGNEKVWQIVVNPKLNVPTVASRKFFNKNIYIQTGDFRSYIDEKYIEEVSRILLLKNLQLKLEYVDFYDIGANYGLYSVLLNDKANITIVEPNPFIVHCLKKTFLRRLNVVIENVALSPLKGGGECNIDIMPRHSGGSSVKEGGLTNNKFLHEKFTLTTRIISLPELISKRSSENDTAIIKIDIEGIEPDIFSSKNTINYISSRYHNFIIFIEVVPSMLSDKDINVLKNSLGDFYCVLLSDINFNYSIKDINESQKFKLSYFYNNIDPIKFSSVLEMAGNNEFNYADVVIISNKETLGVVKSLL
jgi:FkbM family methyltransferase